MTEDNIFSNKDIAANYEQIAILKEHFPNCFDKKGKFLIEFFKELILNSEIETSSEGYSLNWLGKSYARLIANEKPRTLIRPNKEHNAKEQNKNSNNLLIKGDNIEVLKHLRNAYTGSVKVIYIDPPYNTGSDGFIYKDDRKFTRGELANLANISEEEAQRILDFTSKGSNSHSAWLTFIYPRLYIARELLREDGVIFISIDDNEQAQLKLLCDSIFGEENFVAGFLRKGHGGRQDSTHYAIVHEYMCCYAKSSYNFVSGKNTQQLTGYNKYDEEKGLYYKMQLLRKWGDNSRRIDRPNLFYPILAPDGTEVYPMLSANEEGCWRWGKATMKSALDNNDIEFINDKGTWIPYEKLYKPEEEEGQKLYTTWLDDLGNSSGTSLVTSLFNGKKVFNYPKPVELILRVLKMSEAQESSLILDFFAGSGTTAHAAMEFNAEDKDKKGLWKYILVQLPEELEESKKSDQTAYQYCIDNNLPPNIFSITKERIEKAAQRIEADYPEYEGDLGFKIFETIPLPEYYDSGIEKLTLATQGKLFDGSDIDDDTLEAILTTWTLFDRILLTTNLETFALDNYTAYYGKGKESDTVYLMDKGFNINHVMMIIDKLENDKTFNPTKLVLYGHNFDTKSQRELTEALHSYQNKKALEIDIIIRY